MPHISQRKIGRKAEKTLFDDLMRALFETGIHNGRSCVYALLTTTERLMLAKRFAIIAMLEREYSYYRIGMTLKVSISTIMRMHRRLEAGYFAPIQHILKKKRRQLTILEELELFLTAGGALTMGGPQYRKRMRELARLKHLH